MDEQWNLSQKEQEERVEAIRELVAEYHEQHRECMDPVILYWEDTHEYEIVPSPNLRDISWSDRTRPYEIIGPLGDWEEWEAWWHGWRSRG